MKQGTLVLAASTIEPSHLLAGDVAPKLRVGLITDLHYADKPAAGTRYYRETPAKLSDASEKFSQEELNFLVELGDFIDAADLVETEQEYLETINRQFAAICADRHYVLGNHCVDMLTKNEFLSAVKQEQSYYSFDCSDFHFVILDACFRSDGQAYGRKNSHWTDTNIPQHELTWLQQDLKSTDKPVIVMIHQRLDVDNDYGVRNNAQIRATLESSGKVLVVLQGHSHENDLRHIQGIPYCTLAAMVEGTGQEKNGFGVMDILPDGSICLRGFRRQATYKWA